MSKTILATTYAVNPYKGSEDGMGWNFVCQIARYNKVIAITRENNQPKIEKYMQENPSPEHENITFLYFDLPYWMRFWKKGGRGAMLYYWMWQKGIVGFIRRQSITYEVVHNVNFHNDWTPSYLWKLDKPFVWGPIGHHPLIPKQYFQTYSKKYFMKDRLTWLIKLFFWKISSGLKRTSKKADYVVCMNKSVKNYLPLKEGKYSVIPSVATEDFGCDISKKKDSFTIISAGRLVPLKGFDLTIKAFSLFLKTIENKTNVLLKIVGSGPELSLYKEICKTEKIENNVVFIEWIERKDLLDLYQDSSVFLFPSHEGAGMVVAEALSFGLPVVCLNNCGPGEFITEKCGIAINMSDYDTTVKNIAEAILVLYNNPEKLQNMGLEARKRFENYFHWDRRGEQLNEIYQNL